MEDLKRAKERLKKRQKEATEAPLKSEETVKEGAEHTVSQVLPNELREKATEEHTEFCISPKTGSSTPELTTPPILESWSLPISEPDLSPPIEDYIKRTEERKKRVFPEHYVEETQVRMSIKISGK